MYLTEPRLVDIVKKQLQYKFNSYTGVFTSLLIVQVIGIFLGIGANNNSSSYGETLMIYRHTSSNDIVVMFSLIWAFITGILVTTTAYRNDAFTFVSSRLSHHLSSFLFLLVVSVFAGITSVLSGSLIKFITLIRNAEVFIETPGFLSSPIDFFIQISTAIAYVILFAGIGYTIGSFAQRSMLVIPLLLIVLFLFPFFNLWGFNHSFFEQVVRFYGEERSFLLFLLKTLCTVAVLLTLSILVTNNKEVRK